MIIVLLHQGANAVHFQDFNAEVLQNLTIPNVTANMAKKSQYLDPNSIDGCVDTDTRFFSGDWGEVHRVLDQTSAYDVILMAETVYSISALPNLYNLVKKVRFSFLIYSFIFHFFCV